MLKKGGLSPILVKKQCKRLLNKFIFLVDSKYEIIISKLLPEVSVTI